MLIVSLQSWSKDLVSLKTPTAVLLNQEKEFDSFGFEAESKYLDLLVDEEAEGWSLFRKFKMVLCDTKVKKRKTYLGFKGF